MKLRKVSKIVLLVNGILAILATVGLFFAFLALVIAGAAVPGILVENGILPEEFAAFVTAGGVGLGLVCLLCAVFALVTAVLSLKARKNLTKKGLIAVIVFSVLADFNLIGIIAGVLGLIAIKKCPVEEEPVEEEIEEVPAE